MTRHCSACGYTGEGSYAGVITGSFGYGCTEATVMKCTCGKTMWLPIYTQGVMTAEEKLRIKRKGDLRGARVGASGADTDADDYKAKDN